MKGSVFSPTKKQPISAQQVEPKRDVPIIKVHYGTCDLCNRKQVFVVHYNYHIQPKRDFRLCNVCYKRGQIVGLVCNGLLELSEAEVLE